MTDAEPYVDDPLEPEPRPRLAGARALLGVAIVVLLVGAVGYLALRDRAQQDPSLDIPEQQVETLR